MISTGPNGQHRNTTGNFACAALLALALLAGCYPPAVTVTPLGAGRVYPATPDSAAVPLFTTASPACPFEPIASLTAEGQVNWVSDSALTDTLRARVRSIGGHAIVNFAQGTRNVATGGGKLPGDYRTRSGTAIRFTDPACRH